MRVAILSDIHGNAAALRKVLEEARSLDVKRLFVLGDIVGYYYHPVEVLQLLENWSADIIRGNHEVMLKAVRDGEISSELIRMKYGSGIGRALNDLDQYSIERLIQLPERTTVSIDGIHFVLCHGSPWDSNQYIYPDAPIEMFRKCAEAAADFVFMGHTHYPCMVSIDGITIANAGSVGQARDRCGCASWVIMDTSNHVLVFKRTTYDASTLVSEVKAFDPQLPYLHEILSGTKVII